MSIFNDIKFHLQGIETSNAVLKTLDIVFGKHNEIQTHWLKN
jgi:hypothetical protein